MNNHLERFVQAQEHTFEIALEEIRSGRKRSHWMWFIFPQIYGLGQSEMSKRYGICDLAEAKSYLAHPLLSQRLERITRTALEQNMELENIFGMVDAKKFISCMTLFSEASGKNSIYNAALTKFSTQDTATIEILRGQQ